jgi:hypothetical protein
MIAALYTAMLASALTGGSVYLARVTAAWWRAQRRARARRTTRSVVDFPVARLADHRRCRP